MQVNINRNKRTVVSYVVNNDDSVSPSIVGGSDGAESLLTCRELRRRIQVKVLSNLLCPTMNEKCGIRTRKDIKKTRFKRTKETFHITTQNEGKAREACLVKYGKQTTYNLEFYGLSL